MMVAVLPLNLVGGGEGEIGFFNGVGLEDKDTWNEKRGAPYMLNNNCRACKNLGK